MTGAAIAAAALRWVGTPYRHQARTKGAGCDCLGLVVGVLEEVRGQRADPLPPYSPDWGEIGAREILIGEFQDRFPESTGPFVEGEVLLFRMREGSVAKHLGIVAGAGFVHAYSGRGVVETRLTEPWQRRLVARFDVSKGS